MYDCRSENLQSVVVAADRESAVHFHRFAIDVRGSFALAFDDYVVGAEGVDEHIALYESGEHVYSDKGG